MTKIISKCAKMSNKISFGVICHVLVVMINLSVAFVSAVPIKRQTIESSTLDLVILHNNDMHARFEQTDKYSVTCKADDVEANKCFGGFARAAHIIKEYREEAANGGPAVLYLNAGDTYAGTPWFSIFKDKVSSEFMNLLKPDAMSLGNHEFDLGVGQLVPFLNDVSFPVLAANINNSDDHPLWQTKSLKKSTVLDVNGFKIGVIGYITPETKYLTIKSDVEFVPEINAINKEAKTLKDEGVNIIIALGHSGYMVDMEIAKNCSLVDIVIGGHSHTFLYSGEEPDIEKSVGPYPTIITQKGGKRVPVVQAYAFSKYMGVLKLRFDANGSLLSWDGQPILLNGDIQRDPEVLALEDIYRPKVDDSTQKVIGRTKVQLDASRCRLTECNIGNLVSDALFRTRVNQYDGPHLTDAPIAIVAAGDIRASSNIGEITQFDLGTILPFENELLTINVTGKILKDVLEHSVGKYVEILPRGEFLQVSGLKVVYNVTKPAGQRVESVRVLCSICDVPIYEPLDERREYGVLLSTFLKDGGDGYSMFKELKATHLNITVYDAVRKYIERSHIVYPAIEGRIQVFKT